MQIKFKVQNDTIIDFPQNYKFIIDCTLIKAIMLGDKKN